MKEHNIYISEQLLSMPLKEACEENGIFTMQELLSIRLDELDTMPWLTSSMLDELKDFVKVYMPRERPDAI